MNNKFVICGYNVNMTTIIILCLIIFLVFLFFQDESFTDLKKKCSDIVPGDCNSELCAELSFCTPQKVINSDKCSCKEEKDE